MRPWGKRGRVYAESYRWVRDQPFDIAQGKAGDQQEGNDAEDRAPHDRRSPPDVWSRFWHWITPTLPIGDSARRRAAAYSM